MKRISKSFALLCMGLFAVACVEENFEKEPFDMTLGNDIKFSVEAKVADGAAETKTEYGDNNGQYIEVNWSTNDKITIASPEANGTTIAHYDIGFVEDAGGEYSGSHAATVTKRGGVGLQWSESDTYHFYAMYPMLDPEEDKDFNGTSTLEEGEDGAPAVLKGYLPVSQNPKSIRTVGNNYIVDPDMRYAYMVAYDEYDRTAKDADGNPEAISLPFKSLSTVLQFQLKAGSISNQNINQIKVTAVSVLSKNGKPICGNFKYTYPMSEQQAGVSSYDGGANQADYSRITMDFANMGAEIILETGKTLDLTFFLLPIADFDKAAKDLKMQIFYEVNGSPQFMTADIGANIQASRKYYFKNVAMKDITSEVVGSQWISALVENIYISQLSIPVAGNAFSSYYNDGNDNSFEEKFYKEQVNNYKDLWKMGVRGFEFCNSVTQSNSANGTLEDERFVCNGSPLNVTDDTGTVLTFGTAFRYLESMLDIYPNEALFIFLTYKSYTGDLGYYPDIYLRQLNNFLNDAKNKDIKDRLVKLNPTSTVKDLRGKIAIIIRLKDDGYNARQSEVNSALNAISGNLAKMTYVQNWGTAVDCWDRRFGSTYKRQMAYSGSGTNVEYYLGAVSSSENDFNTDYKDFVSGYPTDQSGDAAVYNFTSYGGNTDDLHIQEWTRVVPKEFADESQKLPYSTGVRGKYDGFFSDSYLGYLWTKWYDSSEQKKNMIESSFNTTISIKGSNASTKLYINSLVGYYVTSELPVSYLPYTGGNFEITNRLITYKFDTVRPGAGGDYAGLAGDLNAHFYDLFKSVEGTTSQGPLGFVVMDYIGAKTSDFKQSQYLSNNTSKTHTTIDKAVTASAELPNLILMNNFKFPLAQKQE